MRDFVPVSLLTGTATALIVHPSLPAETVRELIKVTQSRGAALNYGFAGAGANPHIAGELFNYLAKTNVTVNLIVPTMATSAISQPIPFSPASYS